MIDPVGFFVDGSGSGLAELGSQAVVKKKVCIKSVYSWGLSYKKSKKPNVTSVVVDSSVGFLSGHVLQNDCDECKVSLGSKVENKDASISGVSNIENMNNMVTEEMSYVDSNTSETDDMVDDTISKKMHTKIYVLEQLPRALFFRNLSDNDAEIVLSEAKFIGSNQLLSVELCVLEKRSFELVKLFALNIKLSDMSGKTNNDKLIAIKKIFY
ncbi:hypothetical protein G9A89_003196 [Geosiphon pyriformis]|nr:hypothetical protein G9A89_003196 [Geosiphon pyriformis]